MQVPDGLPWIQGTFNKRLVFNKHKQIIGNFTQGTVADVAFLVMAANKLHEELTASKTKK